MAPSADITIDGLGNVHQSSDLNDEVEVMMLGAGLEVGRSCCVIKYKGATVVCDTGVHPAYSGISALPYVDELDWSEVDCILVTHFHMDHAASLPYIMEKTNFKDGGGYVYMTHPTRDVYQFLMRDFVRMSISSAGAPPGAKLYDESELDESYASIKGVAFYEEVLVPPRSTPLETTISSSSTPIKFTTFPAGHVLGAAMFLIEIGGARILYTGDYSTEEDRHLIPASVPNWGDAPDIMVCESTFGVQSFPPREEKEQRFTSLIRAILTRGGRVLMPVFALGRAQELLLILDEYWEANPDLHRYPIYYVSALAAKCMRVYKMHTSSLNKNVQDRAARGDHPFDFGRGRHVRELKDIGKRFDDNKPCVVLAVPGMLQNGVSRQLLEKWAPDRRNGLVLCGYSVEGTLARTMQHEPEEFQSMDGKRIPRRMSVDYISFAAHVDYTQNAGFIDQVKPAHLVLCHGEYHNCLRLRASLKKAYADRKQDIQIYAPANTEAVKIRLARTRIARAIGSLAENEPKEGASLSGILVSKDATYTLLAPKDLQQYTGLTTTVIRQQQRFRLNVGWDLVKWHLEAMYGSVESGLDEENTPVFRVMENVDVKKLEGQQILLEWVGRSLSDMIADSVLALLLGMDHSPATVKLTSSPHHHSHEHTAESKVDKEKPVSADQIALAQLDRLIAFLDAHFGSIELLAPTEALAAQLFAGKEEEKPGAEAKEEGEFDAPIKEEEQDNDVAMRDGADEEDTKNESGSHVAPVSSSPILKLCIDAQDVYIPVDSMEVVCETDQLRKRVESVVELALELSTPLSGMVKQHKHHQAETVQAESAEPPKTV